MKKLCYLLFLLPCLLWAQEATAQQRIFKGTVTDSTTKESIPFVSVYVKGTKIATQTDFEGRYRISLPESVKKLAFSAVGYKMVEISLGKDSVVNVQLAKSGELNEVEVVAYEVPVISKDETTTGSTLSKEQIKKMPTRNIETMAAQTAGVYSADDGRGLNVKGTRSGASPVYVNGVKMSGSHVPNAEHNTEEYIAVNENGFKSPKKAPLSTFSIDVDKASYSNVRRFLTQGQTPPKDAVRIEEMINYFSYDYPEPTGDEPFAVTTEMSVCPWNADNRLVQIGLKGKNIPTDNLPTSNIVFLIDVSGSMSTANKLPLVKAGFKMLVEQLRPQDEVAIVVYAGAAGLVLPPTAGSKKAEILQAIDHLQAGGSTAGGEGLLLAYKTAQDNFKKKGNNRIVLATDGDFNVGVSSTAEMERLVEKKRETGVFLTVLGFGMGNYKDSRMETLADKGNGNYAYVDNILEAKKVFVNEFGGTLFTIAKDVKLQLEFNPAQVKAYRLIGYENRALQDEDFNDDKKDAGELGAGHTVTALYEIVPAKSNRKSPAGDVDDLRYQRTELKKNSKNSTEILTIKLRYKEPDGSRSKLMEQTLEDNLIPLDKTSENFRFAASVAQFGMLLRNSEFKGNSSYTELLKLAESARGKDTEGYRVEFINLVKSSAILTSND